MLITLTENCTDVAQNGAELGDFVNHPMFINPCVFDERVLQTRSSKTHAFTAPQFGGGLPRDRLDPLVFTSRSYEKTGLAKVTRKCTLKRPTESLFASPLNLDSGLDLHW